MIVRPSTLSSTPEDSIATANTFVIGIAASAVAAGLVLFLHEAPARAEAPGVEPAESASAPGRNASAF